MKLSLSGRLWESPKGYRITLKEHIAEAAYIGYEGIEVRYPLLPSQDEIPTVNKLLKQYKIKAVFAFCAGLPVDEKSTLDAQRVISTMKELGASFVRITISKEEDLPALKKLCLLYTSPSPRDS